MRERNHANRGAAARERREMIKSNMGYRPIKDHRPRSR